MEEREKNLCNFCKKGLERMKRCSRCKSVLYCCRDHQKEDWKFHKLQCRFKDLEEHIAIMPKKETCGMDMDMSKLESSSQTLDPEENDTLGQVDGCRQDDNILLPEQVSKKQVHFKQPENRDMYNLSKFASEYLKLNGFCVIDNVLPEEKCQLIYDDVMKVRDNEEMQRGKLEGGKTSGNDAEKVVNSSIRSDEIKWIEGNDSEVAKYPHICDLIGETMDILAAGLNTFFEEFVLSGRTKVRAFFKYVV